MGDHALSEVGVDEPVAPFVGIGECGAGHGFAKPHVMELRRLRQETGFDIAQALPIGKLGEGHAEELLGAIQGSHTVITTVPRYDLMEAFPWYKVHDLRKQRLPKIHGSLRAIRNRKGHILRI